MEIVMKKILFTLLYLITPSIFVLSLEYPDSSSTLFWILITIVYLATIVGLFLYFKFRPCNFLALFIGLLVSPSLVFIYEHSLNSYFMEYLLTVLSTVYYALPLTLLSTIVFIIIKIKRKRTEYA